MLFARKNVLYAQCVCVLCRKRTHEVCSVLALFLEKSRQPHAFTALFHCPQSGARPERGINFGGVVLHVVLFEPDRPGLGVVVDLRAVALDRELFGVPSGEVGLRRARVGALSEWNRTEPRGRDVVAGRALGWRAPGRRSRGCRGATRGSGRGGGAAPSPPPPAGRTFRARSCSSTRAPAT